MFVAVLAVAFVMLAVPAFADGQQSGQAAEPGGQGSGDAGASGQAGDGLEPVLVSESPAGARVMARTETELRSMIEERREQLEDELTGVRTELKATVENQNRVRLAVHALLSMENLTGGIGRNVSAIARDFNNSVHIRERLEERLQNRNMLLRVFMGGDREAAEELELDLNATQVRLRELERLRLECNCSAEVKAVLQEQMAEMEMEQERLRQRAQSERADKGLFGWVWGR